MKAILISYDAKTMIQIGRQTMTMKRCVRITEQLLAEGYKPTERFKPHTNEAYTNGVYVRVWKFVE